MFGVMTGKQRHVGRRLYYSNTNPFRFHVPQNTGAMCFMLVLILDMQPLCLKEESKSIDNVMIYFPHYALGSGMKNIYSSYEYNEICDFQKNGKSLIMIVINDVSLS